ncbi:Asp-tRNA(Asn)/Glu-tRNA(Gln) amidotransferase subunit GatC [Amphibacillus sp. MSJ-3]|uniref:Asp-tRNA(Asn)/Glu-tRNA(Gln) amidotransferase subunit GatC n=1 Tax=Amphibacillus sp. MSJ-3 TaxID=2841505 RepID=UPI001C0F1F66|nr:Asp-tRNA(Asn)/Glu-tRNA(Gln) amidotransferase subunit GatC [Amphibacillus sp. MSJ-3]MBU5593896.1 Asp-tRNA(Asn)/Glu-tRNA(Gln) amidotransferase subunit GatC [Amphibacillus sp. MSJ-3]
MAQISKEQVEQVADIARIAITEEEASVLSKQLSEMMKYADVLKDLDTSEVEPTVQVVDLKNVMRKDEPRQWTSQEEVLNNSLDHKEGQFSVPSILE